MAIEALVDALIFVNGVDLSNHVASVTMNVSKEILDAPVMGDTARRRIAGLADGSLEIELRQDFDAASVEPTLESIVGLQVPLRVRKSKTDPISATNPEYQFNGILPEFTPIAGAVGEVHGLTVTFQISDGLAAVRAVA